ncbi:MAG: glutaminyl-peptide cyclotransferase, partial [Bacteroidales bacterium]|nr:glutaminyl-peptide cyclotransferase [Bacteroidales bacterium]
TWKYLGELYNPREGWGLTTNGKDLILSDGSTKIYFLDPQSFRVRSFKEVTMGGKPVPFINELEWINGEIWANVYTQDYILIIDPATGNVKGRIDCRGLLPASLRKPTTDVLNGIAQNPATGDIYLTGKYWPKMYKVKLVEKK